MSFDYLNANYITASWVLSVFGDLGTELCPETEFCFQNIPPGPRKRYKDSCGLSGAYATNFLSLAPD